MPTQNPSKRKSKVYQVSDEEFIKIIENNFSFSECLRILGLGTNGGSSTDILKQRINELNCSTSHFQQNHSVNATKHSLEDILVENSTYHNISSLKKRLLDAGLLKYECEICKLSTWRNMPITLELDHKNGKNNDHRPENLRLLCPNCHSQTKTSKGHNKTK